MWEREAGGRWQVAGVGKEPTAVPASCFLLLPPASSRISSFDLVPTEGFEPTLSSF
ncbi:MAG: hypothetical protein QOJ64_500 [Acidobacteriota bacterium]|nr:hypothetical protein [Acidobacteriota bacterium]